MPRDSIKKLKFHFGTSLRSLMRSVAAHQFGAAIFICLELADALDHSANDADRELLDSSDQSSCHEASRDPLEPHKLLRHTPQPCELVYRASFILTNKAIG